MSKWDKLLTRIYALSKDLRFDELRKVWMIWWLVQKIHLQRKEQACHRQVCGQ